MDHTAQVTWQKLQDFELDVPEARYPFSLRLARENGWSLAYARRVILEYKRFVLLATAAGHAVTPSDAVDQAWHLHLIYTHSYWGGLCTNVLLRPLHHVPSRGLASDSARYRSDYERTLSTYERWFAERPPADIWPAVEQRFVAVRPVRVFRATHWLVPKPAALRQVVNDCGGSLAANPLVLLLAVGGLAAVWFLNGPGYLVFHVGLSVVAFTAASRERARLREGDPVPPLAEPLNAYEVAYLNGGANLTITTALMNLLAQGVLAFDAEKRLLSRRRELSEPAQPLERGVYKSVATEGTAPELVHANNEARAATIARRLEALGLLSRHSLAPFAFAIAPVLFGALKIMVGLLRDRPVGLLALLCIVGGLVALWFARRSNEPTAAGECTLNALREQAGSAEKLLGAPLGLGSGMAPSLAGAGAGMALALFGASALAGTPFADVSLLAPHPSSAGDGGCGGGDGGCGGGGCGGCGGGCG